MNHAVKIVSFFEMVCNFEEKKCKVQSGHGDVDRPPLWEMDSSSTVEFEYDIEIVMVTRLDRRFLKTRSSKCYKRAWI